MIFMVTVIIIGAIGVVVFIATDLFRDESITRVQETNKDTADHLGDRVLGIFQELTGKMTIMAQFATDSSDPASAQTSIQNILKTGEDIISFSAYQFNEKAELIPRASVVDDVALAEYKMKKEDLNLRGLGPIIAAQKKSMDSVVVLNSSPFLKAPFLSVAFLSHKKQKPTGEARKEEWTPEFLSGRWLFRVELRQDAILKLFSKKKFLTAYLVDATGHLVAHSDPEIQPQVLAGTDVSDHPIVAIMKEGKLTNHQMEYEDDQGTSYLGAYRMIGVAGLGVVAEVKRQEALATLDRVRYRSLLVMISVVCLAFLVNFGFSKSLTKPLKELFKATENIVEGRYDVRIKSHSSDEIGALSQAFMNMAGGLKEREKLKGAFDKFHSKEVAKKLLSGEIKLGGERLQATIFFSDIRGFTSMSEKMTPDQVLSLLNEYMTEMVRIISKWHGVVDKYIGDAIMAFWGVPETSGRDAYNAVRAALEMRDFLDKWNEKRRQKNQIEVKIGIGLHSGEVLAGNMGSESRMNYTVIGDSVNQASRIEAANKPLKADILISDATWTLVKTSGIVVGPQIAIHVKGKKEDLIVHQVIGLKENGVLQTSLSESRIKDIETQNASIEGEEEQKVQTSAAHSTNHSTNEGTGLSLPTLETPPDSQLWYVIADPASPVPEGPYRVTEISLKLSHGQLKFNQAMVYHEGDKAMTPIAQMPGLDRRFFAPQTPPPITAPLPETVIRQAAEVQEWYVHGPQGQTLGPYTVEELRLALQKGNLTRTTYCWKTGLEAWIYLYQIPEFDRRAA